MGNRIDMSRDIIVWPDHAMVFGVRVERPRLYSVSAWLDFWKRSIEA